MTDALIGLVALLQVAVLALLVLLVLLVRRRPPQTAIVDQLRQELADRIAAASRAEREERVAEARQAREELAAALARAGEQISRALAEGFAAHDAQEKHLWDAFGLQLGQLAQATEGRLERMRSVVEERLHKLQEDNTAKLEQMRQTVDEKLHATLQTRLAESFRQVSERLEAVHKGLGEMQSLATSVGDLRRVLTNVKARGTFGEVQLQMLLEQTLSPEQYATNVATRKGSSERVEFAIKLPGRAEGEPLYLPIDCKFPIEDYQRMLDAEDAGDAGGALEAAKALMARIRLEARSIAGKYLDPPNTTDFAILYLPIEGLFAEVLRHPGLMEQIQREQRVVVAGPTTLTALLTSLQMGFRTLAIQRRSSEVWELLGAIKTQFATFGELLVRTRKKLEEATHSIDNAATRSRAIERKLRTVEELPEARAEALLPLAGEDAEASLDIPAGA